MQDLSHSLRKVDYLLIRLNPSLLSLDNKPGEHFSNSSSIAVRHALRSTGTCELHVYRTRFSLISQKSRGCFQLLSAACCATSCAASWLTYYRAPTPWVSQQTTLPVRSHTAESHRSYHLQNLDAAQPRQKDAHRKLSFAKNNAFWENPEKNWLQFSKNQAKF